jgi:hypothetical protein
MTIRGMLLTVLVLLGVGFPASAPAADRKLVLERRDLEERHPELYRIARHGTRISLYGGKEKTQENKAFADDVLRTASFDFAEADLNGDGDPEVMFQLGSSAFSGTSLDVRVEIFTRDVAGAWTWIGELDVYNSTVWVSPRKRGWAVIKTRDFYACWGAGHPQKKERMYIAFGLEGINLGEGYYGECKYREKAAERP